MLVKRLLKALGREEPVADAEIGGVTHRLEECEGKLFFDLKQGAEGADLAFAARKAGAAVVAASEAADDDTVVFGDVRAAYALASAAFYGNPERELKIVTVVGTNGKTTTACMIGHILRETGHPTVVIGTPGVDFGSGFESCELTTPDPDRLFAVLRWAVDAGCRYVVMEESAHAIYFKKTYGITAEVAVFTNFSRDHLDFFATMEGYRAVKTGYFVPENVKTAVVNADDEAGRGILFAGRVPTVSYGLYEPSDTFALDPDQRDGIRCVVNCNDQIFPLQIPFSGEFNLYNALAAVTAAVQLGIDGAKAAFALRSMHPVAGRFEWVSGGDRRVVIDFAHTPDGLHNLLLAVRPLVKGKMIVVFGCGGNRDAGKRPLMGAVAAESGDYLVLTEDNSREEKTEDIIADIIRGFPQGFDAYRIEPERKHAVRAALELATPDDVVVLAGKGAEPYLEKQGIKHPYSDRNEVEQWIRRYNR